jgi:peptidoglycan/LPS O-acetylase OafA/YrhL
MNRQLLINPKSYPNNFDFIRFVLAASVILCHSYAIYYGYEKFLLTEPFMVMSQKQISIGSVAVDFFFIISGFLIVKSFETSSSVTDYFKKRVLRIYPGFIVALLISYLVFGYLGSGWHIDLSGYKQYLFYLHKKKELVHLATLQYPFQRDFFKGIPEQGLNDSVWTIQFEFVCYLLVPLLALIGFFKKRVFFIIAFAVMYALLFLQMKGVIFPYKNTDYLFFANPYHHPRFISYFLAGACIYFYRDKIIRSHLLALLCFILIALSFAWIKCVEQVLPVAGTYLLFYLVYHPGIKLSGFAKHGDFSYGVYLYGWPVQGLIMYYFKDNLNPYLLCITALPVSILLAFCSWHLVENPFLKLKKKKKRDVPLPVVEAA